ncbi:proprotein convertase subtilisin/kexin type 4-like isoform X1 [Podarcis raffonei]|uniref:proprotein convertase subtilisin/kexin type 4-like isoform X1 n=1 Tax=Podarcis raffonei TaxID=65483 RepID=UPI0023295798|nr:proprotein convertase subtilisin/kexin type 4-like isoform X1 [Podarcis raffonei]
MKRVVAAGLVLCLLLLWGRFSRGVAGSRVYLSSWAVRVPAGAQVAQRLARRHGMLYLGQVIEGEHYYHLKHRGIVQRSLTRHWGWHIRLKREPLVPWFEQQTAKRRAKRAVTVVPTDPWFYKQWYINSDVFPDLNVLSAWSQGYTGSGVVVTILDDGIEKDHPDLVANYDPEASYDFNDNDPDPQPRYNAWDENRHGTRCAGEVAATADNDVCGAGIAYRAKIGGVRMLDGTVTDIVEAQSLSFHPQHIDIYSASWGPEDDGKTVDGPGILATEAFHKGIINGRQGLGSLFVWASGNGGLRSDNCNCDGYTNSIYTLSVGSTTERGRVPWYNEACASTLTTTYSSGAKGEKQIVTTDLRHTCTSGHTGTSASAPLAAGMISLALEANPALTWRDMQHIVVRASRPAHLQADDWAVNGVGRKVSHYYGYGLLDAGRLVDLAKRWNTTGPQRKCSIRIIYKPLPIGSRLSIAKNVTSSSCQRKEQSIRSLEHVQVQLSLRYSRRGDLAISLTSPMGTKSTLVAVRPHDTSREGYRDWSFMSTHYWDENPWGVWSLLLENKGDAYNTGSLDSFVLKLYGTEEDMRARPVAASMVGSCAVRSADGECLECHGPFYVLQRRCVSYCPPRYYALSRPSLAPDGTPRNARFCAACHPSCYTCLGGAENNCTACPPFSSFQEANHRCLQHPYYTSRGGEVAREHGHLPLLLAVALMFVGPVVFSLLYGAYRLASRRDKGRKGAGARAESGSEPLCLNQTEECLKEPLRKPFP